MLVHAAASTLGLVMRMRFGFGTPRGLQGLRAAQVALTHDLNAACFAHFGFLSASYWL